MVTYKLAIYHKDTDETEYKTLNNQKAYPVGLVCWGKDTTDGLLVYADKNTPRPEIIPASPTVSSMSSSNSFSLPNTNSFSTSSIQAVLDEETDDEYASEIEDADESDEIKFEVHGKFFRAKKQGQSSVDDGQSPSSNNDSPKPGGMGMHHK